MYNLIKPGRIIFASGLIALAVVQFIAGDYIIGRPPPLTWPAWAITIPGKLVWAYFSASILLIAAAAVIFNKKAFQGAIVIGTMILVYSFFLRHLPAMTDWINSYKTLALGGGAFIVAASYKEKEGIGSPGVFTKNGMILTGSIFLSIFFIISGIAHFKFDEFVINFIPAYIPARPFWTYFAAVALLAGGTGIIFIQTRQWAATLSGIMILLWFFLLHIPRALAAPHDYGEWMGVCESFTFAGILFVLAGLSSK